MKKFEVIYWTRSYDTYHVLAETEKEAARKALYPEDYPNEVEVQNLGEHCGDEMTLGHVEEIPDDQQSTT